MLIGWEKLLCLTAPKRNWRFSG